MAQTKEQPRQSRSRKERRPRTASLLFRLARGLGRTVRVVTSGPTWLFRRRGESDKGTTDEFARSAKRRRTRRGEGSVNPAEVHMQDVDAVVREAQKRTADRGVDGTPIDGGEPERKQANRAGATEDDDFNEALAEVERAAAAEAGGRGDEGSRGAGVDARDGESNDAGDRDESVADPQLLATNAPDLDLGEGEVEADVAADVEAAVRAAERQNEMDEGED